MKNESFDTISDCLMDLMDDENVTAEEIVTFIQKEIQAIYEYYKKHSDKAEVIQNYLKVYAKCDI